MKAVAHLGSGFLHENVCMPYREKSYKIIMLRRLRDGLLTIFQPSEGGETPPLSTIRLDWCGARISFLVIFFLKFYPPYFPKALPGSIHGPSFKMLVAGIGAVVAKSARAVRFRPTAQDRARHTSQRCSTGRDICKGRCGTVTA